MCDEIYKEIKWLKNPILETNSHALNIYLAINKLDGINIKNITNKNCLNIIANMVSKPDYMQIGYGNTFSDVFNTLEQICKTNNVSKPHSVKKLASISLNLPVGGFGVSIPDDLLGICIKYKSYDVSKYILCYYYLQTFDIDRYQLPNFMKLYNNDINLIMEHMILLMKYSIINIPQFYRYIDRQEPFEYKEKMLEIVAGYIDKSIMDVLKLKL
jgi:hypothetical protein